MEKGKPFRKTFRTEKSARKVANAPICRLLQIWELDSSLLYLFCDFITL
jgi:hypothetical protein